MPDAMHVSATPGAELANLKCLGSVFLALLLLPLVLTDEAPKGAVSLFFWQAPLQAPPAAPGPPAVAGPWSDEMLYAPGFAEDIERRHALADLQAQGRGYALGTAELQALIRRAQFPLGSDGCEVGVGRFFVSHGQGDEPGHAGIGATLQFVAMHLGISVGLNRTFLWADNIGMDFSDEATCGDKFGVLCFLRQPSSCTLEDAHMPGADTVHVGGTRPELLYERFGLAHDFIPSEAQRILSETGDTPTLQPVGESAMRYLWRAQCAAFLLMLNDKTLADLRSLRLLSTGGGQRSAPAPSGSAAHPDPVAQFFFSISPPLLRSFSRRDALELAPTFPMRRGTISMHIRHGDKGSEMKLVPTLRYLEAAASLQHSMALSLVQQGFVSTEDPGALAELNATVMQSPGAYERWALRYSDIPRINSNGLEQLKSFTNIPRARLTQLWLLQLLMALECDAWVGTRGSNWNKLIDQLRCVWVPKCSMPYVEVGNPTFGTRQ